MIGLPYPNPKDPELMEQMSYISKTARSNAMGLHEKHIDAGRDFYENLCMKAVNQSIGRSIRHKDDFASIVLIDRRFHSQHIRNRLPKWILARIQSGNATADAFGTAYLELVRFYKLKKTKKL